MRDRLLIKLADLAVNRTKWMVIGSILVTVILGVLAERIEMSPKWSDMLPKGDKRTEEFDRILEEFISASSVVVVVQGEEERIKQFADVLAARLIEPLPVPGDAEGETRQYARRVDYKQELDFIRNHGFMLMKASDLENMQDIFEDPNLIPLLTNINDSFEKEYIEADDAMSTREQEDEAYMFLDGIAGWLGVLERYVEGEAVPEGESQAAVDELLTGDPYFISYDREALILNVIPTFSMMDVNLMVEGTDAIQALVVETLEEFPGVRAGLTGAIPLGRDEMVYSMEGLGFTMVLALVAIGALLFVSLRMWVAPILALVNLLVGLVWAAGITALMVPVLNIMTAMFVVVLLGLGIDFSIHIISTFTEMRALGKPLDESMREGMLKSGKGVFTGALTTAFAFMALMIGDSRAMSEMGLVTGIGLLAVMVSTFTFLPALLVIRERRVDKRLARTGKPAQQKARDISFVFLGRVSEVLKQRYAFTLVGAVILTGLLFWAATRITFNYNYMDIEVAGIPSITLQDTVLDKFDLSMDFAYLVAESADESRELAAKAKEYSSVAMVEDISLYLPAPADQGERRPHIESIQNLMSRARRTPLASRGDLEALGAEIERLEMNVMELQVMSFIGGQDKVDRKCRELAGDPDLPPGETIFTRLKGMLERPSQGLISRGNAFQRAYFDTFKGRVLAMANPAPIRMEELPESILDRYGNKDRSLFLVTVLPGDNIWQDARFLKRFADDLEEMSERATGFPPVFRALIEIIGRDGRNAALLTLVVVFVLLTVDFRKPGHALMAMIPLVAGMAWMVGLMHLVGRQLDVMNLMALPLILGIGIDDGVHIVHRWRREGPSSTRTVFASTGKAILLTSLTTMLAFGSMSFSIWRGYGSLGIALVIGVGACFLTSVIILPGIIGWLERERG
ncbi:MAG: MMPL family transporter [Fidelibacterota bacterium]|nr:MAG: MMPL family transporter [Candidatus Neomarinimicrobiota bacterium]